MNQPQLLNRILIWIFLIARLEAQTYTITPVSFTEDHGTMITYTCKTNPVQTIVRWTEELSGSTPENYVFGYFGGTCIPSFGSPPADYVFDCDATGTFKVTFNVTFTRNDKSKWKCGINTSPTPESAWSDLNVTVALTTLTVSENTEVEDGHTAKITCMTNPCAPVPDISWMKDNISFTSGSVNQSQNFTDNGYIGVSELLLKKVNITASGSYSCSAIYGIKTITSEASILTVTAKATAPPPTTTPVPGDTDCLIILIIIIIIIVILVLALIIFHIVIFYVKVSFKVMGILFFVNVILAVAAIIIGIVGIVAFALCEVIAAIIAIVIGVLTHLYKFFLSKHVLKKADVPHRHLCVCFYAYPWKTDDGDAPNGDAPDAPTNTPATVETIRESSSGNSRVTRNQETVLLTNKTTNSQETDERKDGNKATPAEYGNMNMNIPALGLQSNQGKAQTGDGNGGQTGNETSKSEKGEKKKGSKKKKSKKKKEKQDGSQSPPAVSVSGVAVDDPKTAEEPEEQIRSDSNLTKVVG